MSDGRHMFARELPMRTIQDVRDRLRSEFMEMPGLQLTAQQVERLCGIESSVCRLVLNVLVETHFLSLGQDGRYTRVTQERVAPPRRPEVPLESRRKGRGAESRRAR